MQALLVEDDEITKLLLVRLMKKRGYSVTSVSSGEEALALLETQWFELAFLDLGLPGMSGLALCQQIRSMPRGDEICIIFGTGEDNMRLETMLATGADDYIGKPYQISQVEVRLAVAERRVQDIARRKQLENELIFLARHDPLTRLFNRWQLEEIIDHEASRSGSPGAPSSPCSLFLLDLDGFKATNDNHGHAVGDQLLIAVADALRDSLPVDASLVRYGGDEFVGIVPGIPPEYSVELSDKIFAALKSIELETGGEPVRASASMGWTTLRAGFTARQLLKEADQACYRAKSLGKNRAEVFVEFSETIAHLTDFTPVQQATNAVKTSSDDLLALWFQPVCDLGDGSIVFQEALLRFIGGPGQKPLRAELFLGEINQPRHFLSLDRFVSRKICRSLADEPSLTASIHIHAASICDWKFAEELLREVDRHGIDPRRLILEITETTPLMDLLLTEAIVAKLASNGIRCAVDDLGSGFSSIHLLRNIDFPFVKIDGQLVRQSGRIGKDRFFLQSLQILSQGLGFAMVAEQIETQAQLDGVRKFGITLGQGYLIGHPRAKPYQQEEIPHVFPAAAATAGGASHFS